MGCKACQAACRVLQLLGELQNTNTLNYSRAAGSFLLFQPEEKSCWQHRYRVFFFPTYFQAADFMSALPTSRPPYGLGALCRVAGAGLGRCLLMLSVTVLISQLPLSKNPWLSFLMRNPLSSGGSYSCIETYICYILQGGTVAMLGKCPFHYNSQCKVSWEQYFC